MSQIHLPPIQQGSSGNLRMSTMNQLPPSYGNFEMGQMMPRISSQAAMGTENSYASFKLYEKMREEKIMAVLERQAEYLAKIATKFKIFQDNSNQRLRDRIFELEKENQVLQRRRREEQLLGQINNSLDQRFRNYNESQLKSFLDGNGNGAFMQPMTIDPEEFNKLFRSPNENQEEDDLDKRKKKKKKKKKKHSSKNRSSTKNQQQGPQE